jgi:hypothetical protein
MRRWPRAKQQQTEHADATVGTVEEARHEGAERARGLAEQARHTATGLGERTSEVLHAAAARVPAIAAADLVHEGRERVQAVAERANEATRAAGHLIEETGGRVAATLEHGAPEAAGALATRARRNPLPAVLILLALVALVIWLMRRA